MVFAKVGRFVIISTPTEDVVKKAIVAFKSKKSAQDLKGYLSRLSGDVVSVSRINRDKKKQISYFSIKIGDEGLFVDSFLESDNLKKDFNRYFGDKVKGIYLPDQNALARITSVANLSSVLDELKRLASQNGKLKLNASEDNFIFKVAKFLDPGISIAGVVDKENPNKISVGLAFKLKDAKKLIAELSCNEKDKSGCLTIEKSGIYSFENKNGKIFVKIDKDNLVVAGSESFLKKMTNSKIGTLNASDNLAEVHLDVQKIGEMLSNVKSQSAPLAGIIGNYIKGNLKTLSDIEGMVKRKDDKTILVSLSLKLRKK